MIGRADIKESKSNIAMNAWLPQASYPCGNFSDTSCCKFSMPKKLIGHGFSVCIHTENQNQVSFYPFVLPEISVHTELTIGHLCYCLTDVPPQPKLYLHLFCLRKKFKNEASCKICTHGTKIYAELHQAAMVQI